MRLAVVDGQACVAYDEGWLAIESLTHGAVRGGLDEIVRHGRLDDVRAALAAIGDPPPAAWRRSGALGPPIAVPGTIFGWGANFAEHAAEADLEVSAAAAVPTVS